MSDAHDQNPATAYDADNLNTRDEGLLWTKEFGLNVTADVGDSFNGSGSSAPDPIAAIDARRGGLALNSFNMSIGDETAIPRGRSYLFDWFGLVPEQDVGGEQIRVAAVMAHLYLQEEALTNNPQDDDNLSLGIFVGGDDMVGNDDEAPFGYLGIKLPERGGNRVSPTGAFYNYDAGGDGGLQNPEGEVEALGGDIYVRMLVQTLASKPDTTIMSGSVSLRGLGWILCGDAGGITLDVSPGRLGFGLGGPLAGILDWMRVYNVPTTGNDDWHGVPLPPPTGGHIFTS